MYLYLKRFRSQNESSLKHRFVVVVVVRAHKHNKEIVNAKNLNDRAYLFPLFRTIRIIQL